MPMVLVTEIIWWDRKEYVPKQRKNTLIPIQNHYVQIYFEVFNYMQYPEGFTGFCKEHKYATLFRNIGYKQYCFLLKVKKIEFQIPVEEYISQLSHSQVL